MRKRNGLARSPIPFVVALSALPALVFAQVVSRPTLSEPFIAGGAAVQGGVPALPAFIPSLAAPVQSLSAAPALVPALAAPAAVTFPGAIAPAEPAHLI